MALAVARGQAAAATFCELGKLSEEKVFTPQVLQRIHAALPLPLP